MSAHGYYRDRCTLHCTKLLASSPWERGGIDPRDPSLAKHISNCDCCQGALRPCFFSLRVRVHLSLSLFSFVLVLYYCVGVQAVPRIVHSGHSRPSPPPGLCELCGPDAAIHCDDSWHPGAKFRRSAGGPLDEIAWRQAVAASERVSGKAMRAAAERQARFQGPNPPFVGDPYDGKPIVGAVRVGGGYDLRTGGSYSRHDRQSKLSARSSHSHSNSHRRQFSNTRAMSSHATFRRSACHGSCAVSGDALDCMRGQGYSCCRNDSVPPLVQVDSALRNLRMRQFVDDFPSTAAAVAHHETHRKDVESAIAKAKAAADRAAAAHASRQALGTGTLYRETFPRKDVPAPELASHSSVSVAPLAALPPSKPSAPPQVPASQDSSSKPARHAVAVPPPPSAPRRPSTAEQAAASATSAAIQAAAHASESAATRVAMFATAPHRHGTTAWPQPSLPSLPTNDPQLCLTMCSTFTAELRATQSRLRSEIERLRTCVCTCGCTCG